MTEAEILTIRGDLVQLVISIVSVSFGMISAYIAGLWLFLKDAPIALRLVTFGLLSCGLAFMGTITWGIYELMLGTDRAWQKLATKQTEIPHFGDQRPDFLKGHSLYEASSALGALAFILIYLALIYFTFFFRWTNTEKK